MADLPYTTTANHLLRKVYIVEGLASRPYLLKATYERLGTAKSSFRSTHDGIWRDGKKKDSYLEDEDLTYIRGGSGRCFLWGSSILVVDFDHILVFILQQLQTTTYDEVRISSCCRRRRFAVGARSVGN